MNGEATPAQLGAFLTALRLKGETVEEMAGFASVMRSRASRVEFGEPVMDVVGTGGDGACTFNISTAAAFVAAGAGLKVAKHGNRAMSSQCGSADVLEALGVRFDLGPEGVARCLEEVGIGFMFAPLFHPAMKHAAAPRREIGIRTVFNILGPLTNPAGAQAFLLGVAEASLTQKMAQVLALLGCRHALVVYGSDGIDELSLGAPSQVCQVKDGAIASFSIEPETMGFSRASLDSIKGGSAQENATMLREALSGTPGPRRDVVVLNAAAALLAGDRVASLKEGVALAVEVIRSGKALEKLEGLIQVSQKLG